MRGVNLTQQTALWARLCIATVVCAILADGPLLRAQDASSRPKLSGLGPSAGQQFLTKSFGAMSFHLSNPSDKDLEARVLTFYAGAPETQYGRDIWVPAKTSIWSWFAIGPPAKAPLKSGQIELKSVVRERVGKRDRLVRSDIDQPIGSHLMWFEARDQVTTVMLDSDISDGSQQPTTPELITRASDLRDLLHAMRHEIGMSPRLNSVRQRFLPPFPEAYDGINQFVLASDRIVADVDGQRGLRAWLERGGHLWIPLDWVDQKTVTTLLGDILNLQIIDRTSLSSIRFEMGSGNAYLLQSETREFEEPVEFVRVVAPGQEVSYTVNGWPAAFVTEVGRGRVLFTTLGARGWMRDRVAGDPRSKYQDLPTLPIGLVPADYVAQQMLFATERPLFTDDDLSPYVSSQISYQVVSRTSVLAVFAILFVVLTAAAFLFYRQHLLEQMGWLAPALALMAAGVFFWLGVRSRSAVPPTLAVAQTVVTEPGTGQAQASGLLGVFQPGLEPSETIGGSDGGHFEIDNKGFEGQVRARIQTDLQHWFWDHLELPTGVRQAEFQYTARMPEKLSAILRFGPDGVEGHVDAGPFKQMEDALLTSPGRHALPVDVDSAGSIHPLGGESLETGHLLTSSLLSDRQRVRQSLYEKLLADPQPRYLTSRVLLLGWTDPLDMHFSLVEHPRTTGMALVSVPVRFERTPPGTQVLVPSTFVDCQKVGNEGRLIQAANESRTASKSKLRFQLPASVQPMTVESARLSFRLIAPLRDVIVSGYADGTAVPIQRMSSPVGIERVDLTDARFLQVDNQGALYINIDVGELRSEVERDQWRLEWATLEVRGRTRE